MTAADSPEPRPLPQLLRAESKGYHGIRFFETFGDFAYVVEARWKGARFGPRSVRSIHTYFYKDWRR